ncbi:uncharacterized protein MONBRDRAFT_15826 [Monosiga brevicollis MX1]|uniref:RNB domain-containing protein n=1 Tax=Monosiga brevicollis TaxID=81824 RepID=A9UUB7_MONBE|nr:uncharacterized protein MONBRDRAFT_15826 [Monosiga brevicollis MX1]EDQ90877.1 predicted protein [Monosiga brevicollis MX1]|eukprot:XP_001744174.1 hypothetical protein [Monosiga brevicollis MX1]
MHLQDPILTRVNGIPAEHLQPVGRVVAIIKAPPPEERLFAGFLKRRDQDQDFLLFSPKDSRVPRMRVPAHSVPDEVDDKMLVIVSFEEWTAKSRFARGSFKRVLGQAGTIDAETQAILMEYKIPFEDFKPHVLKCLPKVDEKHPFVIPDDEIAKRRDLRDVRIFTIDPSTARDLDDALHCTQLPDGNFEMGVHIADVSYFVEPNTPLDEEAEFRATSTYLVQSVYPMLPRLLCEGLCSLNPDEDRLAFSVIWVLDPEGNRKSTWFGRTVIRSRCKLAYDHAQLFIDDESKEWNDVEFPRLSADTQGADVKADVLRMNHIAQQMRDRRFANGALRLNKTKLSFRLGEDMLPVETWPYVQRAANQLVEEFMLLANISVAECIAKAFPQCALLRRHPEPFTSRLEEVAARFQRVGIPLDTGSSGDIAASIRAYQENEQDQGRVEVMQLLLTMAMQQAVYFSTGDSKLEQSDWKHYALATPMYTHFTSPIRRYADVVVHRLLLAALENKETFYEHDKVQKAADRCNERKLNAKEAGNKSIDIFKNVMVYHHGPFEEPAIVYRVQDRSMDVLVLRLGLEVSRGCVPPH